MRSQIAWPHSAASTTEPGAASPASLMPERQLPSAAAPRQRAARGGFDLSAAAGWCEHGGEQGNRSLPEC